MARKKKVSTVLDISDLFETPQQRKLGMAAFLSLKRSMGWQLISKSLQSTIDNLTDQILAGENGDNETAESKLYFRDRAITERKVLKGVLDLPDYFIGKLKEETEDQPEMQILDPYDQVDNKN